VRSGRGGEGAGAGVRPGAATRVRRRRGAPPRTGGTALPGMLLALLAWFASSVPGSASAQTLAQARASLRSGRYDEAIAAYRGVLRSDASSVEARRGLVTALVTVGRYDDAEAAARPAENGGPPDLAMANTLGEVLLLTGRLDAAEAAFRRAVDGGAGDRLTAEVNLAELLFERGHVADAMARFDRFIDVYNNAGGDLPAPDLVAVGRAVRSLGRRDPALFQDALKAFDEAAAKDPGWPEPTLLTGELFLEKYESPEAKKELEKVLSANPRDPRALVDMARALDFDGVAGARARVDSALQVNPRSVPALVEAARLHLSREAVGDARADLEKALAVNPSSLDALSMLAAADFVAGDTAAFRRTRARALTIAPRSAEVDATVAEMAVQVRRYAAAVDRSRAAVALDSAAWDAWGLLGMNEFRLGDITDARAHLEKAFTGDPYNPWFKNSLDLLDSFKNYETIATQHFRLFLRRDEAELLAPYVSALAEEAYDSLAAHYGEQPPLPVRVEMYPNHADFSVRTLGETGLGALGVSFGSVLVLDSPAAREKGEYNWASTLWHELSHAFHLAMTNHRVPRWFTEGLAVYEQHRARPGWGMQPTIPFVEALRDGRLKKVSDLDDGFMRPEYPQQVMFSYYEASLVFQLIEERWGFKAIRDMLDGYRDGRTTDELFTTVLGTPPKRFDGDFDAWMKERFAGPLKGLARIADAPPAAAGIPALESFVRAHPGDFVGQLRLGALLVGAKRYDDAEPHLTAALRMFPEYGGADSPYWWLAQVDDAEGKPELAVAALARLNALSESNYAALTEEATLQERLGRTRDAEQTLSRVMEIDPYEIDVHRHLATLAAEVKDHATEVREREAVVALKPPDRAQALYRLAVAQRDAGEVTSARHTVLQALEIAPNYADALTLLLELRTGGGREPARRTSGVAAGPVGNTGYYPSDLTDAGYELAINHVIHGPTP
jgi:tetratricopeptide (TPR) repeat protein